MFKFAADCQPRADLTVGPPVQWPTALAQWTSEAPNKVNKMTRVMSANKVQ